MQPEKPYSLRGLRGASGGKVRAEDVSTNADLICLARQRDTRKNKVSKTTVNVNWKYRVTWRI